MGIPSPSPQLKLARLLCEHEQALKRHFDLSTLSLSKPVPSNRRALRLETGKHELPLLRLDRSTGYAFELRADIASYFPSLYTHALSWAVHGKAKAKKAKNDKSLLGNKLDDAVRATNENQTKGILIGPDTSRILSEIILARVDGVIQRNLRNATGMRFVDDYWFYFESREAAEKFLTLLQGTLAEYELELNYRKTRISALPTPTGPAWALGLRSAPLLAQDPKVERENILEFFERAFGFAESNPDEPVLAEAARHFIREAAEGVDRANVELATKLLIHCATRESVAIMQVLQFIRAKLPVIQELPGLQGSMNESLNRFCVRHAAVRHQYETSHVLTAFLTLDFLDLADRARKEAARMRDPLTLIILAELAKRTRLPLPRFRPPRGGLSEDWLGTYELGAHYGLRSCTDVIREDPFFNELMRSEVKFYQIEPKAPLVALLPRPPAVGSSGIDYDDAY